MLKRLALTLLLIAPIWLVKPLWAGKAAVIEAVKYIEDNGQCITIFIVSIEDDFRLPLQFEIDYDYYSRERVDQRWNKFLAFTIQKVNEPLGKEISDDAQSYITKKFDQIVYQEYFPIKNSFAENGAKYFDTLYRECVKQFNALQ